MLGFVQIKPCLILLMTFSNSFIMIDSLPKYHTDHMIYQTIASNSKRNACRLTQTFPPTGTVMHTHVYAGPHTEVPKHMRTRTHIHRPTHTLMHTCTQAHTHRGLNTCVSTHTHFHTRVAAQSHMLAYAHIYTYPHTVGYAISCCAGKSASTCDQCQPKQVYYSNVS